MGVFDLLVSFKPDITLKKLIIDQLAGICGITFLDEAKDRKQAIEHADALLSWNPAREFSENEYSLMKKARFMQLLSAG